MDEFLQMATSKLGMSADGAKSATGGLLGLIKDTGDAGDVSELFSKLPGAESLLGAAAKSDGGGGGLLASLASFAPGGHGMRPPSPPRPDTPCVSGYATAASRAHA